MAALRTIVLLLALMSSALAEDREKVRVSLFDELRQAPSEAVGRAVEDRIWWFWMKGPTVEASELVKKAMERRRWHDFAGALKILDEAVKIAPEWSEVWNQRAFIHFLRENYDKSTEDLDRALELEPMHFAAMSGKARILMRQGRMRTGQKILRKAVKIHPWLKERDMLLEQPPRDDL